MRQSALAIAMTALLSGCAQLAGLFGGGQAILVEPDAPDVMLVSVPALRAQGYAVPSARVGSVTTWRTADNATFSFDRGVVVSTRGLGDDLMGADVGQSIVASTGGAGGWAPRINGYMNGEYQSYFITFQCRRSGSQSDSVVLGDRSVSATRITETCVNDERQIENTYWRNGNGVMVKSRQWVSPNVGYMETERVIR